MLTKVNIVIFNFVLNGKCGEVKINTTIANKFYGALNMIKIILHDTALKVGMFQKNYHQVQKGGKSYLCIIMINYDAKE